jgi:BlaI family penicillinase repressor
MAPELVAVQSAGACGHGAGAGRNTPSAKHLEAGRGSVTGPGKPGAGPDVSDSSTTVVSTAPTMTAASLPDMSSTVNLTDLQLAIVRILWAKGECTVLEVQEALAPERKLAQTTVATILTRLEKRKIVRHQSKGRLFVYKALVTESQVRRSMVSDLTALLFDGSPAALISHLLSEKEINASDLDEVKRLIADAERGGGGSDAAR